MACQILRLYSNIAFWTGFDWAAHVDAFCFGCSDALSLSLQNIFAFYLRYVAQKLKNKVCNKGFGYPRFIGSRIKERDIQYHYIHFCAPREKSPLFQYLVIISPKAIDGLYYECVSMS